MTKVQALIDGSNNWYRAYCAVPPHLDRPGAPVQTMSYILRGFGQKFGLENIVLCWDSGHSGRKEVDENYKSNRKPVEGVWEHILYMKKVVISLGLRSAWLEGYEADDVIASLATQFDGETFILSNDKDFYQLVNDKIKVLRPKMTFKNKVIPEKLIGRDEVIETFECPPEKVALLKAFKGDTSDNIPRIPLKMTKKFKGQFLPVLMGSDSIDEIYSKLSRLDKKYREKLAPFKEQAKTNYELVLMKADLEPKTYRAAPDREIFENLCREMSITRLKYDDFHD